MNANNVNYVEIVKGDYEGLKGFIHYSHWKAKNASAHLYKGCEHIFVKDIPFEYIRFIPKSSLL